MATDTTETSTRRRAEGPQQTRVEQCVRWTQQRIAQRLLLPGTRMPSLRAFARERGVSKFTAVEAYARLVSMGCLEARRGSGFYVLAPRGRPATARAVAAGDAPIDVLWLLRHMLQGAAGAEGPGLGSVPAAWLDAGLVATAARVVARRGSGLWLGSGAPKGYAPLRQQLQVRLAGFDIAADVEQIVLITGITHALTLLLGVLVRPGEAVLVGDPSWFAGFGAIAAHGARPIGFPYREDGPDLDALERLAKRHRPKLVVIQSLAHNPTGTALRRAAAERLRALAEACDFTILEDDAYADLYAEGSGTRLAALGPLARVAYAGSFTKTLAENLRVGFLACSPALAQTVAARKVLTGFTTPEANERLLGEVLAGGRYRRHVEALRARVEAARAVALRDLARLGVDVFGDASAGLFAWVDLRRDSVAMAAAAARQGLVFAPGALFSPLQAPSTRMRINLTRWTPEAARFLAATLRR